MKTLTQKSSRVILDSREAPGGKHLTLAVTRLFLWPEGQGVVMGKQYYRRYKASGTVKFSTNEAIGESLEDAKKFIHEDVFEILKLASWRGTLELVELSEIQDLGLSDVPND